MSSLTTRIKSSRRASAITVALVIMLVAVAAWFGVISPKRSHVSQLKTDVAAAQSQLATATQAAAVANKAAAAASLRAMPGVSDQPGILDQLNALGKQSNVMIATVTPNLDERDHDRRPAVGDRRRNVLPDPHFLEQAAQSGAGRQGRTYRRHRASVRRPVGQHRPGQLDRAACGDDRRQCLDLRSRPRSPGPPRRRPPPRALPPGARTDGSRYRARSAGVRRTSRNSSRRSRSATR